MFVQAALAALLFAVPAVCAPAVQASDPAIARATAAANVRQAPHVDAPRVAVLREGQQVRIVDELGGGDWHRVADMQGNLLGFVAARLLDRSGGAGDSIFAQQLAQMRGETAGRGNQPTAAEGTGSIFEQIANSGAIEAAHEDNQRREAERRRQEEEERRLAEERRKREEEERERLEEERWDELAREQARKNEWARQRSDDGQDSFATALLGQLQRNLETEARRQQVQRDILNQQQVAEAQRQQQQRLAQQQAVQAQQAAPPRPTASPPPRTVMAPSASAMPRQQRQLGCWATPEPPHTTCVRSSARWGQGLNRDRFIVTHENICSERIVVKMCNERSGGQPLCGQNAIMPGRSTNWDSFKDSTGGYSVQWVGSRTATEDWACASEVGWRN